MIKISNKLFFNENGPPLLIAEISANHGGSKKSFLSHILSAKKNGADLIKIQTYEPEDMVVKKNFMIKKGLWKNKNIFKLYNEAKTPFNWHNDAFKIAKKNNIILFSTPFSLRALNFLKKFNPPLYKISSFEITDLNLINEIAKLKKPIILSTGLSKFQEIKKAIKIIKKYHSKIILLHCISGYPTPIHEANLHNIELIKSKTKVSHVGFSDHTKGIYVSSSASMLNICAIEKHFILNKKIKSHDRSFSITPVELKKLKKNILKNNIIKIPTKKISEKNSFFFRRSLYAIKNILKGDKFSSKNIRSFRPNIGLGAENFFSIINKKAKRNIEKNEVLKIKDI